MSNERRMAPQPLAIRDDGSGNLWLEGYASTFNQPYDMGWYTETVAPGAFSRTLGRSPDVRLLINHGDLPLARTTSGTLELAQDDHGLKVRALLDPTDPDVARLIPKMQRGDLNQMSFAFGIDGKEGQAWNGDMSERTLKTLDLNNGDVSVVTYPANPNASVGLAVRDGRLSMEAVASALVEMERRSAAPEDIASVLTRVLGYFTAVDNIVDAAQLEVSTILGIPNPDETQEDAEEVAAADEMAEDMSPDDGARSLAPTFRSAADEIRARLNRIR